MLILNIQSDLSPITTCKTPIMYFVYFFGILIMHFMHCLGLLPI